LHRDLVIVVSVKANRSNIKELNIIFEGYEKGAIIGNLIFRHLFLHVRCPSLRSIAPFSVPFSFAPRISDLEEAIPFTSPVFNYSRTDQRVSMSVDEPSCFHRARTTVLVIVTLRKYSSCHWVPVLFWIKNCFPQLIRVPNFTVQIELRGTASQRRESFSCCSCLNSLIATVNFGPGFLYQEDPNFVAAWGSAESPCFPMVAEWNSIVNNHHSPLTIDVELESVAARRVDLLSKENFLNSFRIFC